MKITKTEITEKEVNIELPYFAKKDSDYFAIISEGVMLQVSINKYDTLPPSVRVTTRGVDSFPLNGVPITAKMFEAAYMEATEIINTQFEAMRDTLLDKSGSYVPNLENDMA